MSSPMGPLTAPAGFRGAFRTDAAACGVYSESAGIGRIIPCAVAVPIDTDDVVTLVRWAYANGIPLIPRGSGSSMGNGAVGEWVIVDLGQLRTYAPANASTARMICGTGIERDRAEQIANQAALSFPVDPSSGAFATLGGMVACNSAGARSVRFGATREWVTGLECIFADGTRAWIRRGAALPTELPTVERFLRDVAPRVLASTDPLAHVGVRKESSGYALAAWRDSRDLVDLLVGSEGTLALFVNVELRLIPMRSATASLFVTFDTLEAAVVAAGEATRLGATAVELLDKTFLDIARSATPITIPESAEGALLIEAEGDSERGAADHMRQMAEACRAAGAASVLEAPDDPMASQIWAIRHAASPTLSRLHPYLSSMQVVEDGAVPPAKFPAYVRGVRAAFAAQRMQCVIFGHAGDAHAHVNALVDVREADWRGRLAAVLADVTALIARLGGTLSAEHGDGRLRTPLLAQVWNAESVALFAATKLAFDPTGILNPGVKVPLAGQEPFPAIKYDPEAAAIAPEARVALDAVNRSQGWAQHRLGLL